MTNLKMNKLKDAMDAVREVFYDSIECRIRYSGRSYAAIASELGCSEQLVFVAAFDRIARSTRHFLQVLDELESMGVEFVSAREAIDTSGPMGRIFLTLIGAISSLERDLLCDRVRQGIARRRLMGLPVGRQPLDVDRESIVASRLSGMSLTDVAKRYGVSRASVVRWVREAKQASPALPTSIQPIHEFREEVAA